MITSINSGKGFYKIQHPFTIKTLQKAGREGTYLNVIKAITTANITFNGKKLKAFPLRTETRERCHSHHFYSTWFWTSQPQQSEEIKGTQIEKEELNLSLFIEDMILYTENPKVATRKLLVPINEFGKIAGYKDNIQKSVAFL